MLRLVALRRALVAAAGACSSSAPSSASSAAARAPLPSPPPLWLRSAQSQSAAVATQQPSTSSSSSSSDPTTDPLARARNKLIYRAKQRGFLELDLLVGLWADRALPAMATEAQLRDAALLLDAENPDLFKWLTGQDEPPEEMKRNTAFSDLHAHVRAQMREHAHPGARAAPGQEWARGWDDAWKKGGAAEGGAAAG
jgi:succinate dehydrogenase flavin-adding protein (antitoxin of CptAB toxin-antitoxin module)